MDTDEPLEVDKLQRGALNQKQIGLIWSFNVPLQTVKNGLFFASVPGHLGAH